MERLIKIKGAREHNLKDISIDIPKDKFVVITGLSGSGKSTLAFDTIYAEGQRRYVESLSAYARQFLEQMQKPDVDVIEGLSPAIAIEQRTSSRNPRSTLGTVTEIYDYLRLLFASEKTLKQLDNVSMTETIKRYGKGKMKLILEIFSRSITTINNLDNISTGEMFRAQRNLYKGSKPVGYPIGGLGSITKKFADYIIQTII